MQGRLIEHANTDLVPVIEKLTTYSQMKQAHQEKEKFMKSIKSFNIRTKMNQVRY